MGVDATDHDVEIVHDDEDQDVGTVAAPETPALSLVLVMEDPEAPPLVMHLFDAGYPEGYFIKAKAPASEAAIQKAARRISIEDLSEGLNRQERRSRKRVVAKEGDQAMTVELDDDEFFIQKCLFQITDFRLVNQSSKPGMPADLKYDESKRGRNPWNEQIYRAFLKVGSDNFRDLVEKYLDWVAGRGDEDVSRQFEILGNAPGPLPNGS